MTPITSYIKEREAYLSNLIFDDHEGVIEHVDIKNKKTFMKLYRSDLLGLISEIISVASETFSQEDFIAKLEEIEKELK